MPIRKKKISELTLADSMLGLYTIGVKVANGVQTSVKVGLEYIQTAYENVVKATAAAIAATTDMRKLEATVEENEESRETAESQRNASEQGRKNTEIERISAETERNTAEGVRLTKETERQTKEADRITEEGKRVTEEGKRVTEFGTLKKNSELATGAANAGAANAEQAAIGANTAADNADKKAALANTAASNANDTADHPTYIGADHYVYKWNKTTKAYDKTDIYTKGDAFSVKKVYASVELMEADVDNVDIKEGDFVLVNTANVENPDNAKLYVKIYSEVVDPTLENPVNYAYEFLVDMSGAIGFTGKTPQLFIGTITTSEAGTEAKATVSENGTDSDGNPKYKLSFSIPRGNPGAPFQVKDTYATVEALKVAIPDGSAIEGFIAVGDKIPYDYYAWVNGDWMDHGKIVGDGGGKMVLIPGSVFELTNTSTSNEILNAFGGKEAFIDSVTKVKNGAPAAADAGDILLILPAFIAIFDTESNSYVLRLLMLDSISNYANWAIEITLTGDVATVVNEKRPFGYANVVNIPIDVWNLVGSSTSSEIIDAFGGKSSLIHTVNKIRAGGAIVVISHSSQEARSTITTIIDSLAVLPYNDDDNFTLILSSSGINEVQYVIRLENGIASLRINGTKALTKSDLVSTPSIGGTDVPASAEAVKVLNDKVEYRSPSGRFSPDEGAPIGWYRIAVGDAYPVAKTALVTIGSVYNENPPQAFSFLISQLGGDIVVKMLLKQRVADAPYLIDKVRVLAPDAWQNHSYIDIHYAHSRFNELLITATSVIGNTFYAIPQKVADTPPEGFTSIEFEI